MDGGDVGDLCMLLLSTLEVVKEYESPEVIKKIEKAINDICIHQLDCESILEETKGNAQNAFIQLKDWLLETYPIQN